MPAGLDERRRLLMLGQCLLGLKRHDDAASSLRAMLAIPQKHADDAAVDACNALGDALAGMGRIDEASALWLDAAELKPQAKLEALARAKAATYHKNRIELDTRVDALQAALSKSASAHQKAGEDEKAMAANLRLLGLAIDFPDMRQTALETAEQLLTQGRIEEAAALFLRVLDTGQDRCFTAKARLSENQRQLNLVAIPPPAKLTLQALAGINRYLASAVPGDVLPPEKLKSLGASWTEAVAATYRPKIGTARPFMTLAGSGLPASWRALCLWQAACAFLREGNFENATKASASIPAKSPMPIGLHARFVAALARMGAGDHANAALMLSRLSPGVNATLASSIRMALVESLEMSFDFTRAEREYRAIAEGTTVIRHKAEAEYAVPRLKTLMTMQSAPMNSVVPIPDDRSTRGDWATGYGMGFHLLAAHEYKRDTTGGQGPKVKCLFSTTLPTEKSRLWVSATKSDDVTALWNPPRAARTTANRDDYGEQHPIGKGPDLLMSCEIPQGTHLLSLYFVNDRNYYESNRNYTISVADDSGCLLALAQVRDFGGGLYKRFAVDGPRRLNLRIWRNTSLNVLLCGVFLDTPSLPMPPVSCLQTGSVLSERYLALRDSLPSARASGIRGLIESCSLNGNGHASGEDLAAAWMRSRLLALAGRPMEGLALLREAAAAAGSPEALRGFITEAFADEGRRQRTLAWFPPGTHELDILWDAYFALLDKRETSGNGRLLLALAQSREWMVTCRTMREAARRLDRSMRLPAGVNLATRLCIAGKAMDESRNAEALAAMNELEADARKAGDTKALARIGERLLSLSSRFNLTPEQLIAIHSLLDETGATEAQRGEASVLIAMAFERRRNFDEARKWLAKVPGTAVSDRQKNMLLERWKVMESLKNRKEVKK